MDEVSSAVVWCDVMVEGRRGCNNAMNQPLRLSNFEIASELHRRSLAEPSRPTCRLCGDTADFGHDEVCNWRREKHTIARHDQVVLAIGHALHTLDDRVVIEPHTYEGRRRNDIRLAGSNARGRTAIDYDVKIYSLMAGHAHSTTTRKPVDSTNVDHAVVYREDMYCSEAIPDGQQVSA